MALGATTRNQNVNILVESDTPPNFERTAYNMGPPRALVKGPGVARRSRLTRGKQPNFGSASGQIAPECRVFTSFDVPELAGWRDFDKAASRFEMLQRKSFALIPRRR